MTAGRATGAVASRPAADSYPHSRSFADDHQVQHDSLLRTAVLEKRLLIHTGNVFTRKPRSLRDVVEKIDELELGIL